MIDIPKLFLEDSKIYNQDLYEHITIDSGPVLYRNGRLVNILEVDFTKYVKELSNILENKFGFINDMSLDNNLVKPYIESLVYDYDAINKNTTEGYVYLVHNLRNTINNFIKNSNTIYMSADDVVVLNDCMVSTNSKFKKIIDNTVLHNNFIKKESVKIFPFKWKNKVIEDKDILTILITWN